MCFDIVEVGKTTKCLKIMFPVKGERAKILGQFIGLLFSGF